MENIVEFVHFTLTKFVTHEQFIFPEQDAVHKTDIRNRSTINISIIKDLNDDSFIQTTCVQFGKKLFSYCLQ